MYRRPSRDAHTKARAPSGPAASAFATTARTTGVVRRALAVCDTLFARAARPARDHPPLGGGGGSSVDASRLFGVPSARVPRPTFARLPRGRRAFSAAGTDDPLAFMSPTSEPSIEPPEGFAVLQEGKARILTQLNDVFYNKAQVVNRDISLAVMRQFQKVRAEEHASLDVRAPKNKRNKGNLCATPRDSPILPHLLTPEEIEQMYLSHE